MEALRKQRVLDRKNDALGRISLGQVVQANLARSSHRKL